MWPRVHLKDTLSGRILHGIRGSLPGQGKGQSFGMCGVWTTQVCISALLYTQSSGHTRSLRIPEAHLSAFTQASSPCLLADPMSFNTWLRQLLPGTWAGIRALSLLPQPMTQPCLCLQPHTETGVCCVSSCLEGRGHGLGNLSGPHAPHLSNGLAFRNESSDNQDRLDQYAFTVSSRSLASEVLESDEAFNK